MMVVVVLLMAAQAVGDASQAKIKVSDLKEKEIELGRREEALQALERSVVGRGQEFATARETLERDSDCSKVIHDLKAVEERNSYLESKLLQLQEENFALVHEKHSKDEMDRRAKLRDGYQPQVTSSVRRNDKWDTFPTGSHSRSEL